jgi:hypothetical protein
VSDSSQILVDVDVAVEDAGELARDVRDWLIAEEIVVADQHGSKGGHWPGPRRRAAVQEEPPSTAWDFKPNTVDLRVGRQVFDTGGNDVEVRCASCGETHEPEDAWFDAVGAWADGDDAVRYSCGKCGVSAPLVDWRGPWQWAFGSLGVEFWNWPPLSERFIQRLAQRLGHRLVLVQRTV